MTLRVHELATDLGLPPARVLELLRAMSTYVKGPSSSVETQHADVVRYAYEATVTAPVMPDRRPAPRHQRAIELIRFSLSGYTEDAWLAEQERIRHVNASRQDTAAKSRELYEAEQLARREANRRRWGGSFEGPREPKIRARAIVFQGGAPGLGKRH